MPSLLALLLATSRVISNIVVARPWPTTLALYQATASTRQSLRSLTSKQLSPTQTNCPWPSTPTWTHSVNISSTRQAHHPRHQHEPKPSPPDICLCLPTTDQRHTRQTPAPLLHCSIALLPLITRQPQHNNNMLPDKHPPNSKSCSKHATSSHQ